jgi:hypothetical protein
MRTGWLALFDRKATLVPGCLFTPRPEDAILGMSLDLKMIYALKIGSWAVVAACLTGCYARSSADLEESPPEIQLEGVGLRFFRGNELRAVGRAQRATFLRNTADGTAQAVKVHFLASQDRPEIDLVAREVRGNTRTQDAIASGGVRLSRADGAVGTTERAHLAGAQKRADGELPVDVVGEGYRVHAVSGFTMDISVPGSLALRGPVETHLVGGAR